MRRRDCEDYKVCVRTNDLRKKRSRCPKAKEIKFITNADRIRAMTDEELAEFFGKEIGDSVPTSWRDWLKQEVDDGEQ